MEPWIGLLGLGLRFFVLGVDDIHLPLGMRTKNYYEESRINQWFLWKCQVFYWHSFWWMNPPSARISATNTKNLRSNPPKTWFECLRKMPWIQVWKIGPKCLKCASKTTFSGSKKSIEVPMVETRWNKYISLGGIPHLTICSFLWRAQYKPSLSTLSGPGISPIYK